MSPIPGTTRDVVEVTLNFGGYPVVIGDTAGIRIATDEIEREGIQRAKDRYIVSEFSLRYRFNSADIKICVLDITTLSQVDPLIKELFTKDTILVLNKDDLFSERHLKLEDIPLPVNEKLVWRISCKTGNGVSQFLKGLEKRVEQR